MNGFANNDGTLDVIRGGVRQPYSYAAGQWTDVEGDQKSWKKGRFSNSTVLDFRCWGVRAS